MFELVMVLALLPIIRESGHYRPTYATIFIPVCNIPVHILKTVTEGITDDTFNI